MSNTTKSHKLTIDLPFDTEDHARIALQSIEPDKELKPDQVSKKLGVKGTHLIADFEAISDRVLRVTVNSFMDSISLVIETIEELENL